jgi:hypothetical protein
MLIVFIVKLGWIEYIFQTIGSLNDDKPTVYNGTCLEYNTMCLLERYKDCATLFS